MRDLRVETAGGDAGLPGGSAERFFGIGQDTSAVEPLFALLHKAAAGQRLGAFRPDARLGTSPCSFAALPDSFPARNRPYLRGANGRSRVLVLGEACAATAPARCSWSWVAASKTWRACSMRCESATRARTIRGRSASTSDWTTQDSPTLARRTRRRGLHPPTPALARVLH